jgi:hypothetical protein
MLHSAAQICGSVKTGMLAGAKIEFTLCELAACGFLKHETIIVLMKHKAHCV